ncbi:hypothetical protein EHO60_08620 [Leptospira fletcheri]|uniref:TIGR04452 family lipoprotein n=1 Tax=Leptospira fletcheri TaxID=2484981 RepID=A0A4R9GHV9_9LEPT|nr:hypothetical protein EHO60_08620 [Leptospira fletcheri]
MKVINSFIILTVLCFFHLYGCIQGTSILGPSVTSSDAALKVDMAVFVGLAANPNASNLQSSSFSVLTVIQQTLGVNPRDLKTKFESKSVDDCTNNLMLYAATTTTNLNGLVIVAGSCKLKKEPI